MAANQQAQTVQTVIDVDALVKALADLKPKPEITEGSPEYIARLKAEGFQDDFFGKTVYQNSYEAQARGLSSDTRKKASELRPGKYLKGRVTVELQQNGDIVRLPYPVSGDHMMKNQALWRDFSDLIAQIWAEMESTGALAATA